MAVIQSVLTSGNVAGILAYTDSIFDKDKNKFQSEINQDLNNKVKKLEDVVNGSEKVLVPIFRNNYNSEINVQFNTGIIKTETIPANTNITFDLQTDDVLFAGTGAVFLIAEYNPTTSIGSNNGYPPNGTDNKYAILYANQTLEVSYDKPINTFRIYKSAADGVIANGIVNLTISIYKNANELSYTKEEIDAKFANINNNKLKVLLIGSSHGVNTIAHFPILAYHAGIDITVGNLYKGGIRIGNYYDEDNRLKERILDYCNDDVTFPGVYNKFQYGNWEQVKNIKIKDVLVDENWDYIIVMKSAEEDELFDSNNIIENFTTYLEYLKSHIQGSPKFIFNSGIADALDENRLAIQQEHTKAMEESAIKMSKYFGIEILPTATIVQLCRNNEILRGLGAYEKHMLACDTQHLDQGIGEYITGCMCFEYFLKDFHKSCLTLKYYPTFEDIEPLKFTTNENSFTAIEKQYADLIKNIITIYFVTRNLNGNIDTSKFTFTYNNEQAYLQYDGVTIATLDSATNEEAGLLSANDKKVIEKIGSLNTLITDDKSSIVNAINEAMTYSKGDIKIIDKTSLVDGYYIMITSTFRDTISPGNGFNCGKFLLKKNVKYILQNNDVNSSAARSYAIVNKDNKTFEEIADNGTIGNIITKEFLFEEDKYLIVNTYTNRLDSFLLTEEFQNIKTIVKDIENIYSIINPDTTVIPIPSENTIIKDGGNLAIFKKIAICGDSLGSGEIAYGNATGEDTTQYKDMYEQSWIQFLGRSIGRDAYNFSRGGVSAKNFFTDSNEYVRHFENANYYSDCYFIALGHNDYNNVKRNWETQGYSSMKDYETVYIGSSSDINKSNPNANADTYYGNYAKIIQKIHQQVPHAKIFVVTMMNENIYSAYNTAIRNMANIFDNIYVVDMAKYFPTFPSWHYTQGHGNAMGYLAYSQRIATIVDYIIKTNREAFMYTSLILTNYDDGKDYASYIPSSADISVGSTL